MGYEAWTVNNSYSLILCVQRDGLLALIQANHWEEKKRTECYAKSAALSCKHSSAESSICTVSHARCHTDNVTFRSRLDLTCQLSTHHNSCMDTVH